MNCWHFSCADRRILPWNQWPEISWHDPLSPSFIGDMPHSWIGAEYILAVRSLFAYEREADHSLVIAAGVAAHWLDDGGEIVVRDLPTYYGRLSYRLRRTEPDTLRLTLEGELVTPPGGIIVLPPLPGPLSAGRDQWPQRRGLRARPGAVWGMPRRDRAAMLTHAEALTVIPGVHGVQTWARADRRAFYEDGNPVVERTVNAVRLNIGNREDIRPNRIFKCGRPDACTV